MFIIFTEGPSRSGHDGPARSTGATAATLWTAAAAICTAARPGKSNNNNNLFYYGRPACKNWLYARKRVDVLSEL